MYATAPFTPPHTGVEGWIGKNRHLVRRIEQVDFVSGLMVTSLVPKHRRSFTDMTLR